MMEKRGRSPSLRRKNSIDQQQNIISPELITNSVVEQKKLLTSAELKKIPIYSKYTVSSLMYAQNVKRPAAAAHNNSSFDKTKSSPRRSVDKQPQPPWSNKVMPAKTKSNEDNLSSSYTKPSSPKPEDTNKLKPHPSRNYVNVMESTQKKQQPTAKGNVRSTKTVDDAERKQRFHDDDLLSSKDDHHNLTTDHQECDNIDMVDGEMEFYQKGDHNILRCDDQLLVPKCLEDDMPRHQSNTCSHPDNNVTVVESVNSDQPCERRTFDAGGDHLISRSLNDIDVDKENQKAKNEELVIESTVDESDEERKRKAEPEVVKEGGDAAAVAPNKEDKISKMVVAYQQVVAHGKKDIATYSSSVREETTISKRGERRSNKVKALVGAFESAISHEYDVLPKRLLHINNKSSF